MNKILKTFSSFSVNDLEKARNFYGKTLGLKVTDFKRTGCEPMLMLNLQGGAEVLIYPKKDHVPATFTILNFQVEKIEDTVKDVSKKGVTFEKYEGTDDLGITHNEGPEIAWFKDPAGNFLAFIQNEAVVVKDEISDAAKDEIKITHFIPTSKEEVFKYWTTPDLVEQWAYPDGMTLKVPKFEAKKGGSYIFEHTADEGVYLCSGYFKEFIPNEKLVQLEMVKSPDGEVKFSSLECDVEFISKTSGTEIRLTQKGFTEEKDRKDCLEGWTQCLEKLDGLINKNSGNVNQASKNADQVHH